MANGIHTNVAGHYPDYLRDESRRIGTAASISFPAAETEIREALRFLGRQGLTVTLQGARTGITGGSVPAGGHVMNLSRMTRVLGVRREEESGRFLLSVEPGVLLGELNEALASRELEPVHAGALVDEGGGPEASREALARLRGGPKQFFAPDPTEVSASIGGMVACNASGARSFLYGATRRHVQRLRVVLADGSGLVLARGHRRAEGRRFRLQCDDGRALEGVLPSYDMPRVKSAAGYFAQENMDLVDLFVGAEGTLGVVTEIEVGLLPIPEAVWGVTAFLPGEEQALDFVERTRSAKPGPVAVEFFSSEALALLRAQKRARPAFEHLPELPVEWDTAVYLEYHGAEGEVEEAVMAMTETMADCGGSDDATWLASDPRELERLKAFRHAVPECVNLLVDERKRREPGLTKLGTDLAVPDAELRRLVRVYREGLAAAGLEFVIFGHIGDNHVHVNLLPRTMAEYERGKQLYLEWAGHVVDVGGSVSAEHGIGKLKTDMLRTMYGERGIAEMRAVKRVFDPAGMLNPGNLWPAPGGAE